MLRVLDRISFDLDLILENHWIIPGLVWDPITMLKFGVIPCKPTRSVMNLNQGIRIKGREMALVWHEKASRTVLQTSS